MNNIPRFGRKGLIKRLQNAGSTSLSKIRAFRNRRLRLRLRLAQSRGRLRKNLINVANHIFNINVKKSRIAQLLLDKFGETWQKAVTRLFPVKGSFGNHIRYFHDGTQAFLAMWTAIQNAKETVWLETFILKPDTVGLRTIKELTDAAKRGVRVILLFDWGGSYQLRNKHLKEFHEAKGISVEFHNLWTSWKKRRWLYPLIRDHRKLLIVDNQIAFCGGMNIADDYAGPEVGGNGRFRDTHAEVRGPGVFHLANVFLNSLKRAMDGNAQWKEFVEYKKFIEKMKNISPPLDCNGIFLQVLESDAWAYKRQIQNSITLAIERARSHIYITTPYFLPPQRLKETIVRAAQRGVKVSILTAGKCDVPIVNLAARHVYETFLKNDVAIYEMVEKELHAKTTTIDGLHNIVGSFNLDDLSHRHMLEVTLVSLDTQGAKNLEEQFQNDLKFSKRITLQTWAKRSIWMKIISWLSYQLCRAVLA